MEIDFTNITIAEYFDLIFPNTRFDDLTNSQRHHIAAVIEEQGRIDKQHADEIKKYVKQRQRKNLKVIK